MDNLTDMLRLMLVPGIGAVRLARLIETFGSAGAVLAADFDRLARVKGLGEPALQALARKHWSEREVERQVEVMESLGARPLFRHDDQYPAYLTQLYDAPPLLFVRGELEYLNRPCLAVVGTRGPSFYGREMAKSLSAGLAAAGFTIVSGLARGIDSLAHEAALDAGGTTVAVLGCGVDRIYPSENEKLAGRIVEHGCIVSEYLMGTPPEAKNFPRRNRIISGLSRGVLVVEAGKSSGALITASYALDQDREVFAVPGDAARGLSHGTNRLIQQGAKLVQTVPDVLSELGSLPAARPGCAGQERPAALEPALSREERRVFDRLSREPVHVDELAESLEIDISILLGILLRLQMKQLVREYPGKLYSLG
ncbi:MAG: DNA-processing protein DprA [Candidatus Glassbacteria bacterium]|nr:DNA-processing protein DprA [Candidatus Glassbacteria bacterium]